MQRCLAHCNLVNGICLLLSQLHFSLLDLELHARYTPGGDNTVFDVDQARAIDCSLLTTCQGCSH